MSASGERQRAQLNALLDEAIHERTLRRLLWGIVAVVLLAVAWSILAQVDELTQARAEVQPIQRVQVVQSKEGGVLEAILVQVGDAVKPGQVIARFGASDVERDRVQVDVRRDALRIDLERWAALAEGRQPDFSAFAHRPKLVEEARALFAQQEQGGARSCRRAAMRCVSKRPISRASGCNCLPPRKLCDRPTMCSTGTRRACARVWSRAFA